MTDFANIVRNNNDFSDEEWQQVIAMYERTRKRHLYLYPKVHWASKPVDATIPRHITTKMVVVGTLLGLGICWFIGGTVFWIAVTVVVISILMCLKLEGVF